MNIEAAVYNGKYVTCDLHNDDRGTCNRLWSACPIKIGYWTDPNDGLTEMIWAIPADCPNRHGFTSNEVLKELILNWRHEATKYPEAWFSKAFADELEAAMKGGK